MSARYFVPRELHSNNGSVDLGQPGSLLHTITINDPGSGWVLTVTDGASGTAIATIKPSAPVTLVYDSTVTTSIHVAMSGTTAGSATVSYA